MTDKKLITELPLKQAIVSLLKHSGINTIEQLMAANTYQVSGLTSPQRTKIKQILKDYKENNNDV